MCPFTKDLSMNEMAVPSRKPCIITVGVKGNDKHICYRNKCMNVQYFIYRSVIHKYISMCVCIHVYVNDSFGVPHN